MVRPTDGPPPETLSRDTGRDVFRVGPVVPARSSYHGNLERGTALADRGDLVELPFDVLFLSFLTGVPRHSAYVPRDTPSLRRI